jgi:hypothetical protein
VQLQIRGSASSQAVHLEISRRRHHWPSGKQLDEKDSNDVPAGTAFELRSPPSHPGFNAINLGPTSSACSRGANFQSFKGIPKSPPASGGERQSRASTSHHDLLLNRSDTQSSNNSRYQILPSLPPTTRPPSNHHNPTTKKARVDPLWPVSIPAGRTAHYLSSPGVPLPKSMALLEFHRVGDDLSLFCCEGGVEGETV